MTKISSSPQRGSFMREHHPDLSDLFADQQCERELDPEWQKNNLEYDLRTTDWILEKVRASEVYAQHLYAVMCNNDFKKLDVLPILLDETWSCSWRHAGGIVADMQQEGDYIDWYCSGIRNDITEEDIANFTPEHLARYEIVKQFVPESYVTEEIEQDLRKLGWLVIRGE